MLFHSHNQHEAWRSRDRTTDLPICRPPALPPENHLWAPGGRFKKDTVANCMHADTSTAPPPPPALITNIL